MGFFHSIGKGLKKGFHSVKKGASDAFHWTKQAAKDVYKEGKNLAKWVGDHIPNPKENIDDLLKMLPMLLIGGVVAIALLPKLIDSASNAKKEMDN
jgi:hypothetical protein